MFTKGSRSSSKPLEPQPNPAPTKLKLSLSKRNTCALKENTMKNLKLVAFGIITALSRTYSNLASAQSTNWHSTTQVAIFSSSQTSLKINAMNLIDNIQLVRLQYGFLQLEDIIKVKQIISPDALKVSMSESCLGSDENGASIELTFDLESTNSYGTFLVKIILENTQTGQTTTMEIVVTVQ
jgi:hypothetical protein